MQSKGYKAIAAIGIIVAIGAIGFAIWSMTNNTEIASPASLPVGEKASETMEVSSASILDFEGFWEVVIVSGKPNLSLAASKDQLKSIKFSQNGDQITLRQEGMNFGRPIKVELSMPAVADVRFKGAGSLEMNGYQLKNLRLSVQGGTSVTMADSSVENLDLSSEGACNIDLDKASVTNALVNLRGASNAKLKMNGGTLAGKIEGVGNLAYSGSVSSETVKTDGLAKVEKE
jgi:hypothetical protein